MRHHDTRPIAVIGAGLAGLTAAARLARAGLPVTVLERGAGAGGRARTTERDGYLRNLGPHALAMDGPGTEVLRELGIALPGRAPAYAGARFLVDGEPIHALARRQGGAGLRLLPAFARLARAARGVDPDGSVGELLGAASDDTRVHGVLTAVARLATYADALDEQAADVLTEQLRGGAVRYLDGGWGALVDRLRSAVLDAGGTLRHGAGVERIVTHDDGRLAGVELADGSWLPAQAAIVANGGPGDAAGLLEGPARSNVEAWARRAVPVRLSSLDLMLRRRPRVPTVALGIDEPTYLAVHSDRAQLAPDGGAVIHVARFLPLDASPPADGRARLEGLLDELDPSWRGDLVHARYLPAIVLTHDAARAATGGRRARPGPAVPGSPGLFVAGDWVGTRGYLAQASLASAAEAAELAAAHATDASRLVTSS